MCGITGIFDTRGRRDDRSRELLHAHERVAAPSRPGRGRPAPRAGRRASATGGCRSSTSPPASSRCSTRTARVVVVFNGEIYNYQELIPELQALGHAFRTRSDTEVIVHAWEEWGERCVERFRGMFAFALWDRNRADAVPRARPAGRQAAVLRAAAPTARCSSAPSSSRCWRIRRPAARHRSAARSRSTSRSATCAEPRTIFTRRAQAAAGAHADRAARRAACPSRASTGTCASRSTARSAPSDACAELDRAPATSRSGCA